MSSLKAGTYIIRNNATNEPVGRSLMEDHSLGPKYIISYEKAAPQFPQLQWKVTLLDNGRYELTVMGFIVARYGSVVLASHIPGKSDQTEWAITYRENVEGYIVTKPDDEKCGWAISKEAEGEEMPQLQCVAITATKSETWEFVPFVEDATDE